MTIPRKRYTAPACMGNDEELRKKICQAIEQGKKDLSLIGSEDWQEYRRIFGPFSVECSHPYCHIDRRKAICSIYNDYCNGGFMPFSNDKTRQCRCLDAINNYFAN